jgi:hypothetical protein
VDCRAGSCSHCRSESHDVRPPLPRAVDSYRHTQHVAWSAGCNDRRQEHARMSDHGQAAALRGVIGSGHLLWALLSSFASLQAGSTPLTPPPHPLQASLAYRRREWCVWSLCALTRGLVDSEPCFQAETHRPAALPEQGQEEHRYSVRQARHTHDAHGVGCSSTGVAVGIAPPRPDPLRTLSWAWRGACRCEREGNVCTPRVRAAGRKREPASMHAPPRLTFYCMGHHSAATGEEGFRTGVR